MKRLNVLVGAFMVARTAAFAHGGNDYVRGVVTKISAQSVPVQTADKASKTLMLTDKTTLEQAGKVAQLSDLHVGDRLVIEVANTTRALLMQVGAAPKTADSIRVSKVEMPNSSKYRFRAGGTRWPFFSINPAGPSVFLQSLIASPRSARDGPSHGLTVHCSPYRAVSSGGRRALGLGPNGSYVPRLAARTWCRPASRPLPTVPLDLLERQA